MAYPPGGQGDVSPKFQAEGTLHSLGASFLPLAMIRPPLSKPWIRPLFVAVGGRLAAAAVANAIVADGKGRSAQLASAGPCCACLRV